MHTKQEIITEAFEKLNASGNYEKESVQVPVTLLGANYSFYTYNVLFVRDVKNNKQGWITKEITRHQA